jgi:hypothetical protein
MISDERKIELVFKVQMAFAEVLKHRGGTIEMNAFVSWAGRLPIEEMTFVRGLVEETAKKHAEERHKPKLPKVTIIQGGKGD